MTNQATFLRCPISRIVSRLLSFVILSLASLAHGQFDDTTGIVISDNRVGYIDSALIADQVRLRYDFNSDITNGSRAEFFYTSPGSGPDALPLAERNIRFQDITFILEREIADRFSAMIELPVRFFDPLENESAQGLSDMNVAIKYALVKETSLWTAQFRVYIPTGDADRGLGNNHVSLEPALLIHQPLSNDWTFEGELRYWLAIDGGPLAGSLMRYGMGVHRSFNLSDNLNVSPVVEFVGWTILDGSETKPNEGMPAAIVNAAGVTVVNGKFGARIDNNSGWDIYIGYGRVLTDNSWYENIVRAELRIPY